MNREFIIDNLDETYPHFCSIMPSGGLVQFTPTPSITQPININRGTQLFNITDQVDHYRLSTQYDCYSFPFIIDKITDHTVRLRCLADSFIWPANTPLLLQLVNSDDDYSSLTHHLHNCALNINKQPIDAVIQFYNYRGLSNPFDLINNLCNIPHYLLSIAFIPQQDITLSGQDIELSLTCDRPLNHLENNLLLNTVYAANYIQTQSEPIRICATKLEYPIHPETMLTDSSLTLCAQKTTFFLAPGFVAEHDQMILSLPIICYQKSKLPESIDLQYYQSGQSEISTINIASRIHQPIYPVISNHLTTLLEMLNFNYLIETDPTQQLKSFLTIHNRNRLKIITDLIESIATVTITPSQINTLSYEIHFSTPHHLQPLLLHILNLFFEQHRPINTHIEIKYVLPIY